MGVTGGGGGRQKYTMLISFRGETCAQVGMLRSAFRFNLALYKHDMQYWQDANLRCKLLWGGRVSTNWLKIICKKHV